MYVYRCMRAGPSRENSRPGRINRGLIPYMFTMVAISCIEILRLSNPSFVRLCIKLTYVKFYPDRQHLEITYRA